MSENVLLFGGTPFKYLKEWEITSDLQYVEKKIGVVFTELGTKKLINEMKNLNEENKQRSSQLAAELINGSFKLRKHEMPPLTEIEKAIHLYYAMKELVLEHNVSAVTIDCTPWIYRSELPVPCLALMLFQEEGTPAACQGDIDALLTMILLKRVGAYSTFMGGAVKAKGMLGICHCVMSRKLASPMQPIFRYQICDYHNRKPSPTVFVEIPKGGTATVTRLTHNLKKLLLTSGKIVGSHFDNWRCRNKIVIEGPNRQKVFKSVKGKQNHFVVAVGDYVNQLTNLATQLGIEVERI